MPEELDSLEEEVDDLNDGSSIFRFNAALKHLEEAASVTDGVDLPRLRTIVSAFIKKIPDLPTYKRVERDGEDLADNLMLTTLEERIAKIKARNEALADLTTGLQTEIAKANNDANLLQRIKDGIDKATTTVNQAKSLIDQLTATDTSTKKKLKALIDALAGASKILSPNTA
jgi:hypothetical protein